MPPMSSMKNGSKPSMRAGRARTSPTASSPCAMDASVPAVGPRSGRRLGEVTCADPAEHHVVGGAQHGGAGEGGGVERPAGAHVERGGGARRDVDEGGVDDRVRVEPVDEERDVAREARSPSRRRGSRPGRGSPRRAARPGRARGRRPRPRCGPSAGRRGARRAPRCAASAGVATVAGRANWPTDQAPTASARSSSARTVPSSRWRDRRTMPCQMTAVSLTTASTSRPSRGCTVSRRGAYACLSAYQSGLGRSSPSIAAQEVTGQQSLSCQTIAPAVRGHQERKCSMPNATARAWLSWVGPVPVRRSRRARGRWGARPRSSLPLPSSAFWCSRNVGSSLVSGRRRPSWTARVQGGPGRRALEAELASRTAGRRSR